MSDFFSSMGMIDLAALVVVTYNMIMGLVRGFVWQAARLTAVICGLILARLFGPAVADWIENVLSISDPADNILSYVGIFFGVFLLGTLLAYLLRGVLATLKLQSYDRLLGVVLGGLKGGVIVIVMVLLLSRLQGLHSLQTSLGTSHSGKITVWTVERVGAFFPDAVKGDLTEWWQDLEETVQGDGQAED